MASERARPTASKTEHLAEKHTRAPSQSKSDHNASRTAEGLTHIDMPSTSSAPGPPRCAPYSKKEKYETHVHTIPGSGRRRVSQVADNGLSHKMKVDSSTTPPPRKSRLNEEERGLRTHLKGLQDPSQTKSAIKSPSKRPKSDQPSVSPKRMRIQDNTSAREDILTCAPLVTSGIMCGSDDDESTPSGLKSGSSPVCTTASDEDDDSDDDDIYAELRKHEQTQTFRRSSRRGKETVRFDPASDRMFAIGSSVFGGSLFGEQISSKSTTTTLRAIMRERSARERQQEHIAQVRENIADEKNTLTEKEAVFDTMAREEQRREAKRVADLDKFSAPIPLFTTVATLPEVKNKYMRKQSGQVSWHSLHHMALEILSAGRDGDRALPLLKPVIDMSCREGGSKRLFGMADLIFHLLIYDDTICKAGGTSRDSLMSSLVSLCERKLVDSGQGRLPTLVSILESYGAFFEDSGVPEVYTMRTASTDSLEASMGSEDFNYLSEPTVKATRNLKRAFLYAASRVRLNDKLHRIISRKIWKQDREKSTLYTLGVCVRVLLSVFGARLATEVGYLIAAVLSRVNEKHWASFRRTAAKYILSITTRLGLHVELVAHLLPYHTDRARSLALDIGFLSLVQWSSGPGDSPKTREIHAWEPSSSAKAAGVGVISFCLADLVDLAKHIPDFQKTTNVEWACGIARMLKQILADQTTLARRGNGELNAIHQSLTKLRSCAHRLEFGLAVQEMRLALDALLLALRELVGNTRLGISEISPKARFEKVQTHL